MLKRLVDNSLFRKFQKFIRPFPLAGKAEEIEPVEFQDTSESFLEMYKDIIKKPLILTGIIGEFNSTDIRTDLIEIGSLWKKLTEEEKTVVKDLHLMFYINSNGGSATEALSIYDYLNIIKREGIIVEIHCTGEISSAANLLVCVGNIRKATINTTFMLHEAAYTFEQGTYNSVRLRSVQNVLNRANATLINSLIENTKFTEKSFKKAMHKHGDYYFTAEQAIEHGLLDSLL